MQKALGLLLCSLFLLSCASDAGSTNPPLGNTRPVLFIGDHVSVVAGVHAQASGEIVEIALDENTYRVLLSGSTTPVMIPAHYLRRSARSVPPPTPPPEPVQPPPPAAAVPAPPPVQPVPVIAPPPTSSFLGRLAVLPIIGVDEYTGETLAWHLANEDAINTNFQVVPITPQIRKNVSSEETYSAMYNAGEDVNADYIMTSFARTIGCQRIFFTIILDIKTRQQLAGDYRKYDDVQDILLLFPAMSKKIVNVIQSRKNTPPKLSIELIAIPPHKPQLKNDAAILTQLFAIAVANTNAYQVFPRTDNIDAAMLDYETRRTTAAKVFITRDEVTASEYVLSGKIDMFDTKNQMLAEIVDIGSNVLRRGAYIDFDILEDLPESLGRLAGSLTAAARQQQESRSSSR